jgi:hypothetical protein
MTQGNEISHALLGSRGCLSTIPYLDRTSLRGRVGADPTPSARRACQPIAPVDAPCHSSRQRTTTLRYKYLPRYDARRQNFPTTTYFYRNKKRRGEDTPQMHFCTFVRTHPHLRARRESALGLLSDPVCTQVLSCTGRIQGSALFSLSFLSFRGRLQGGGPICGGKNVSGGTMPRCASHHADPSSDCSKAAGVWWRRRNRATRRIRSASLTD